MTINHSEPSDIWEKKGKIHWNNKDYEIAERCFDKAIEINPHSPYSRYCKAALLWRRGKEKEALSRFEAIEEDIKHININGKIHQKNPIQTNFPNHNPFQDLAKIIRPDNPTNEGLKKYIQDNEITIKKVVDEIKKPNYEVPIQYNTIDYQKAYLLLYFPYYIENIYSELSILKKTGVLEGLQDHISVNIFGCGPAPEYLGLLTFVSQNLFNVNHLTTYFFDREYWNTTRNTCIEVYSPNYCKNNKLILERLSPKCENLIVLLQDCDNYPQIKIADIHIFQHSFRELLHSKGEGIIGDFWKFFSYIKPGSIVIFIENIYEKDTKLLEEFANNLNQNSMALIFRDSTIKWTFKQVFSKPMFLDTFFERIERTRNNTNYSSTVLLKV
ncbi:tetratricopeptide repeat protein [Methanospirillum sp.]